MSNDPVIHAFLGNKFSISCPLWIFRLDIYICTVTPLRFCHSHESMITIYRVETYTLIARFDSRFGCRIFRRKIRL